MVADQTMDTLAALAQQAKEMLVDQAQVAELVLAAAAEQALSEQMLLAALVVLVVQARLGLMAQSVVVVAAAEDRLVALVVQAAAELAQVEPQHLESPTLEAEAGVFMPRIQLDRVAQESL